MRCKASTVVRIKIMVVCVRRPCGFVVGCGHFRETVQLVPSSESAQVAEAADSLKTLVITRLHGNITLALSLSLSHTHTHTHTPVSTLFYCTSACCDVKHFVCRETLCAFLATFGIPRVSILR
jgi:hypothetical protein